VGFSRRQGGPSLINDNAFYNNAVEGNFMEHTTEQLASGNEAKIGFYFLMGSYFGDWNFEDDFMRAAIATPNYGLAAVWVGIDYTHWQFHGLGVGETIGHGLVQSIKHRVFGDSTRTWMSIIGDPTLRMNVIAPPYGLQYNAGTLSWQAGEQDCEYYVYHADDMEDAFERYAGPLEETELDSAPSSGVLMVRAAKPVTTGSATFTNLSQGAFYEH